MLNNECGVLADACEQVLPSGYQMGASALATLSDPFNFVFCLSFLCLSLTSRIPSLHYPWGSPVSLQFTMPQPLSDHHPKYVVNFWWPSAEVTFTDEMDFKVDCSYVAYAKLLSPIATIE